MAVDLIEEACESGARLGKACEVLEISVSTFRRWASGDLQDKRKGASKKIPRKLTDAEIQEILAVCCSKEYEDDSPCTIHASLLDKGRYVASVSSFYRVLREANLIKHRRNSKPGKKQSRPPELKATGPNQVWTWDITWLKTEVRGLYYYGYTIIDIWDRSIVKWAIHDREDEKLARELFDLALRDEKLPHVHVHSDNGNPMKGMTLLAFFHDLGISTSFSRARVSDDNPFIESWFKTLKYDVSFPKAFKSIGDARLWLANFVAAYNSSHRHSGLHYMTPLQVRKGEYGETARKRNETMKAANCKNPQRWSQGVKQLPLEHCVYLNPTAETRLKIQQISAKQVA